MTATSTPDPEETIFARAVALPAAYFVPACGGDAALSDLYVACGKSAQAAEWQQNTFP